MFWTRLADISCFATWRVFSGRSGHAPWHQLTLVSYIKFRSFDLILTFIVKALTYREWLTEEVDKGIIRCLTNEGWGDPIHFLARRAQIDSLIPNTDDDTMAIKHGKLSAFKVLATDHGISGLIDWDWAQVVPLPATVQQPDFIADIPGYINEGVEEGMNFEEDRNFLEREVRKLAARSTMPGARRIAELLETSYQRQFLEMSLRNRKINAEWALKANEFSETKVALAQLQAFLISNPFCRGKAAAEQLLNELQ